MGDMGAIDGLVMLALELSRDITGLGLRSRGGLLVPLTAAVGFGMPVLGVGVFGMFGTAFLGISGLLGARIPVVFVDGKFATLLACFSTSWAVFGLVISFLLGPGLFLAGVVLAGRCCFKRTLFRSGFTSGECSRLMLLSERSLRADETPLELLVLLPVLGAARVSPDLNNLSLSSMEFLFCWGV